MKRIPPLTREEIVVRLHVDMEQGKCFWVAPSKNNIHLDGKEAGCARLCGGGKRYWVIKLNGVSYRRSHIILMIKTGQWPANTVDHTDGDSLNDRDDNVRHATYTQNAQNLHFRSKRSGLPMGVNVIEGRFGARIQVNGVSNFLGLFSTPEEASAAYQAKRLEHFGEFA